MVTHNSKSDLPLVKVGTQFNHMLPVCRVGRIMLFRLQGKGERKKDKKYILYVYAAAATQPRSEPPTTAPRRRAAHAAKQLHTSI